MEAAFAQLGQDKEGRTTEQQLQDELAGDDVRLNFVIQGQVKPFHTEVFKQGQTYEWVKNKVAIALEAKYQDLLLYYNDKRIPEPFCLVDTPHITSDTTLEVRIAEGAVIGLDKVRATVEAEMEQDLFNDEEEK